MADAVLELGHRLDAVSQWAGAIQGRIKAMEGHQQAAAASIEALIARAAEADAVPPPPMVDGAIGYHPSPEQQAGLFMALAEWQCTAGSVDKAQEARIKTRAGDEVTYRYADIGGVSDVARSAGKHGLAHFHREIVLGGQSFIRTYLVHSGGGWISSDVPLLVRENNMISSLQQWASACTMARRYGLFMVLGIAVAEDDDDGGTASTFGRGRPAAGGAAPARAARPANPTTTSGHP